MTIPKFQSLEMSALPGSNAWTCLAALLLLGLAGCTGPRVHVPRIEAPVRVGSVQVDAAARCVIATGYVNQIEGVVELLACGPGGKKHESVFVLSLNPLDLQTALLMLRLKPGQPMKDRGVEPPTGSPVAIWIAWDEAAGRRTVQAHELLYNHNDGSPVDPSWLFTGSVVKEGRFMALEEESFITTYWDPWAVINFGGSLGGDDDSIFIRRGSLPPLDTPVTVLIQAL